MITYSQKEMNYRGACKKALSDIWLTTRFSFQITSHLLVKQKENLTLHQLSVKILFCAHLQLKGCLQSHISDFLGSIFFLVQMSSVFACDLGPTTCNRKTLPRNFFCCFVFHFWEIMQVFLNQPGRQMRASLILLFGKTKPLFGKDTARKNIAKIGC